MQSLFLSSANSLGVTTEQAAAWWKEIAGLYSGSGRHYHTLRHLEYMAGELTSLRERFADWLMMVMALA